MVRCRRAKGQKTRTTQGGPSGRHASRIGERAAHRVAMQMKRDRSKMTAEDDRSNLVRQLEQFCDVGSSPRVQVLFQRGEKEGIVRYKVKVQVPLQRVFSMWCFRNSANIDQIEFKDMNGRALDMANSAAHYGFLEGSTVNIRQLQDASPGQYSPAQPSQPGTNRSKACPFTPPHPTPYGVF